MCSVILEKTYGAWSHKNIDADCSICVAYAAIVRQPIWNLYRYVVSTDEYILVQWSCRVIRIIYGIQKQVVCTIVEDNQSLNSLTNIMFPKKGITAIVKLKLNISTKCKNNTQLVQYHYIQFQQYPITKKTSSDAHTLYMRLRWTIINLCYIRPKHTHTHFKTWSRHWLTFEE